MSRPSLGKGLGDLMQGAPVVGKENMPGAAQPPEFGRGLSKLVKPLANVPEENAPLSQDPIPVEALAESSSKAKQALLPAWFFFSGDLLLLAFSVAVCFGAPKPLDFATIAYCTLSVGTGALLGIAGVMRAAR